MPTEPELRVDGRRTPCVQGASVAAALIGAGQWSTRTSVGGERRGPLCGMGICYECCATIDGRPHQRSCMTFVRNGIDVRTTGLVAAPAPPLTTPSLSSTCDVLVVGAGPAGLAAASAASERDQRVIVIDDNAHTGGQIWRGDASASAEAWRVRVARADVWTNARVVQRLDEHTLAVEARDGVRRVRFRALILATGASELFLPFPGWTLPNVMGAGGLQALSKSGLDLRGKRVVVCGSGPLLLAVAAHLRQSGAEIACIAEQAPAPAVRALAWTLARHWKKLRQALDLRSALRGVPYRPGFWPSAAHGDERVRALTLTDGVEEQRIECDFVACGFGLVPSTRLAVLLGCALEREAVRVDAEQRTSVADIFAVGECTGIGGVEKALIEGQIAGAVASGHAFVARTLARAHQRELRFARALDTAFKLRRELLSLARADTIVCRCEDVRWGTLARHDAWREAKLITRCGMGPCQARVCGPALAFLRGWRSTDARPPLFSTPLSALIDAQHLQGS
jgi:D-hydroxyproline dehydrogenase subunit alpha